jgi:hypothetical protein
MKGVGISSAENFRLIPIPRVNFSLTIRVAKLWSGIVLTGITEQGGQAGRISTVGALEPMGTVWKSSVHADPRFTEHRSKVPARGRWTAIRDESSANR